MATTLRATVNSGATTVSRALTHEELDANFLFTQSGTGAVTETVQGFLRRLAVPVTSFLTDAQRSDVAARSQALDVTTAVQAALDTLSAGTGTNNFSIYFPPGDYKITGTIQTPNSASNLTLFGAGKNSTRIVWAGSAGSPMLKLRNARRVVVKDMSFIGNGSAKPSYGILVTKTSGMVGSAAPAYCRFEGLFIGGDGACMTDGIGYTCDNGDDNNNEQGLFLDCTVSNVDGYGLVFRHLNSLLHRIEGCHFENCATGAISNIGDANSSVSGVGGSFTAVNCGSGGCATTFALGGSTHAISIHGMTSEGDTKLLTTPSSITGTHKLKLSFHGCDWEGSDGTSITFDGGAGNVLGFFGCNVVSANGVTMSFPTAGPIVTVDGGSWTTNTLTYACDVNLSNYYEAAGAPTYTKSGAGVLRIKNRTGTTANGTYKSITSGATFSAVNGVNTPDGFVIAYGGATTLTNITDGYHGQEIWLFFDNGNATITNLAGGAGQISLPAHSDTTPPGGYSLKLKHRASNDTWYAA